MVEKHNPVFVIALDGLTFEIVHPLIQKGLLPNLAQLMERGCWGTLRSTVPPISPTAWASFMTGKNPGKHSVLDFTHTDQLGKRVPVNATVLDGKSVWQILSECGRRVGVVNVPMTFPPEPVNGLLVGGFPMPRESSRYTYPKDLASELESRGWNLAEVATQSYSKGHIDEFVESLYRHLHERLEATLWMMHEREWDFFMVHFIETDKIQHELLNFWDMHQREDASSFVNEYAEKLERFFYEVDVVVGRLLEELETFKDSNVMVISDHGFGPCYKVAHVYNWLIEQGYLRLKGDPITRVKSIIFRAGWTPINLFRFMPASLKRWARKKVDEKYFTKDSGKNWLFKLIEGMKQILMFPFLTANDVDWSATRAYSSGSSGLCQIYLSIQNHESSDIVRPDHECESLRREIGERLREWKDPISGERVIEQVYTKDQLYTGDHIEEAPDILATFKDSNYLAFSGPLFLANRTVEQINHIMPDRATHKMNGTLIACGPGIEAGRKIAGAQIVDIAPTILYALGCGIPRDMDGEVLRDCFRPEFKEAYPVRYQDAKEMTQEREALTGEEEAKLIEQLRDMGYL